MYKKVIAALVVLWFLLVLGAVAIIITHAEEPTVAEVVEAAPVSEVTEPVEIYIPLVYTIEVPETAEETEPLVDPADLEALAIVIYQEAGGNAICDECRYRVADVVMNRVADPRFPDTIEGVLLQEGQYGRLHWTGICWSERAQHDCEQEAVARAYRVAEDVLTDARHSDLHGNGYIWQAGFSQGSDWVYCCGHYFGR